MFQTDSYIFKKDFYKAEREILSKNRTYEKKKHTIYLYKPRNSMKINRCCFCQYFKVYDNVSRKDKLNNFVFHISNSSLNIELIFIGLVL